MSSFDHRRIRDEQDRSFTIQLLDAVKSLDPDQSEWIEAVETLRWLDDYRSVRPLRALIEDSHRPTASRSKLATALTSYDLTTTSADRIAWWRSGDEVLQAYALRLMEQSEAAIVLHTATDADHPLQAHAVAALEWGFEEAEYQDAKVAALASPRPEVRDAAIYAVSWDEPLAAEPQLRRLLSGEDSDVARAAAYALQYYPSLATLEQLRGHTRQGSPEFERQRNESIDFIEGSIEGELARCASHERRALQRWAEAIDFGSDQADAEHRPTNPSKPQSPEALLEPVTEPEAFDDDLDTTKGSFLEKAARLRSVNWETVAVTSVRPSVIVW